MNERTKQRKELFRKLGKVSPREFGKLVRKYFAQNMPKPVVPDLDYAEIFDGTLPQHQNLHKH